MFLAALAVAGIFEIPPERLRESPCEISRPGKMRGERLEHNGIVIWNDSYNSNPGGGGAPPWLTYLRATPARRACGRAGGDARAWSIDRASAP